MSRPNALIFVALALAACGGSEGPAAPTPSDPPPVAAPARADTLVIAHPVGVGHLNPVIIESAHDSIISESNILLRLAHPTFDCSIKKSPEIATEWSWSDDGTVLSFTLRDDLRWADGRPVTAHDVKFTFDLIADPAVASPRLTSIQRMVPDKRPLVIDDTHLAFHFTHAYDRDTQFAHATAVPIVPKHILEGADRAALGNHPFDDAPLGDGPWKIGRHDPGQALVLEPNPAFSGDPARSPRLNRVIFRILPDYNTRLLELEKGGVDMMDSITIADADRIVKERPEIKLHRRGWRFLDYVAWNLSNPLFQDVKVRRALALATDTDSIIERLLTSQATGESFGRRAVGTITPELCGVHNDDIKPLPFDVAASKALFAEAGWVDTDADGVLDKDGKKFAFTLLTNRGNQRRADAAVILQAMLKEVGVEVNLAEVETNALFETMRKREYEAALSGWSASLFVDPSTVWHSDTPERRYDFNFTGYSNPAADALMDKGLATPDPKDAAPTWKELQRVVYEDQPYLFLYWRDDVVALHERFDGAKVDILSSLNDLHAWSVQPAKVKYPN